MFDTSYVCRIRYCRSGIAAVLETKLPIFFLSGIWYVYRESEKSSSITIVLIPWRVLCPVLYKYMVYAVYSSKIYPPYCCWFIVLCYCTLPTRSRQIWFPSIYSKIRSPVSRAKRILHTFHLNWSLQRVVNKTISNPLRSFGDESRKWKKRSWQIYI